MSRVLPILFNTEMVRAILEERKTVTRRLVRPKYRADEYGFEVLKNMGTGQIYVEKIDGEEMSFDPPRYVNPPYQPGDILYVRETWNKLPQRGKYIYKAGVCESNNIPKGKIGHIKWRPSIHMPKEAARIWLRVVDVRIEHLWDIDDDGVVAEGLQIGDSFEELWDATVKRAFRYCYGWDANPWVWVIEFERCEKPESNNYPIDMLEWLKSDQNM